MRIAAQALLERLNGDVKPDLIPILEAIRDGFGNVGHAYRNPFDKVFLDPGGQTPDSRFTAGLLKHLDQIVAAPVLSDLQRFSQRTACVGIGAFA